jgi:hypothetical protein
MKYIIASLLIAASIFGVVSSARVSAQFDPFENTCEGVTDSTVCTEKNNNTINPLSGTGGILVRAARFITLLTGIASIIIIIISALKYILSAGDSNAINSAKNTILYALVGLVLSISGQAIISFVINRIN